MDWSEFVAAALPAPDSVTYEAYLGAGPDGDELGPATVAYPCYVETSQRRVRIATQDAAGGEVLGSITVFGPPSLALAAPVGSWVTTAYGGRRKVLQADLLTSAGQPIAEHTELVLE